MNERAAASVALRQAIASLRERGHVVDAQPIWEPGQGQTLAYEACALNAEGPEAVVVACGGDGTVHEAVEGLLRARDDGHAALGLGIVPSGTANDLATSLGLPLDDLGMALRLTAQTPLREVDALRLDARVVINVASMGFPAQVTAETPGPLKRLLGGFAYVVAGILRLGEANAHHVRVEGPGFEWEGEALLVCVGNGQLAGGGFEVCPRARMDDGLLDVTIVPDMRLLELPGLLSELSDHEAARLSERMVYAQLPRVRLEADARVHLNVDGEPMTGQVFDFEVIPRALRLALPEASGLLVEDGEGEA